jgi:beta-phosphoglucomutase-like phosphatase (HAD superfamily)
MRDVPEQAVGLQAVLFDVDGTLYRQGPVRRAMLTRIVRHHAMHPARGVRVARIISAYRTAQEELRSSGFAGDVAAAQLEMASARAGVEPDEVRRVVEHWIEDVPLDVVGSNPRNGLVEVLDVLAVRGTRLGVVSDYPATRKLEALGIADRFEVVVSAQDPAVGAFKPAPSGLIAALQVLRISPDQALYVGDRADVDGTAAAAAGMRFHLVGDAGRGKLRAPASANPSMIRTEAP